MATLPGHVIPLNALAASLRTPRIQFHNTAPNDCTVGSQELHGRFNAKIVEAAVSSQATAIEGSFKLRLIPVVRILTCETNWGNNKSCCPNVSR